MHINLVKLYTAISKTSVAIENNNRKIAKDTVPPKGSPQSEISFVNKLNGYKSDADVFIEDVLLFRKQQASNFDNLIYDPKDNSFSKVGAKKIIDNIAKLETLNENINSTYQTDKDVTWKGDYAGLMDELNTTKKKLKNLKVTLKDFEIDLNLFLKGKTKKQNNWGIAAGFLVSFLIFGAAYFFLIRQLDSFKDSFKDHPENLTMLLGSLMIFALICIFLILRTIKTLYNPKRRL